MSRSPATRLLPLILTVLAGILLLSCTEQGPRPPVPVRFDLAPGFASDVAGIVPLSKGRFILTRVPGGELARDTVIDFPAGQDSIDLSLTVMLLDPGETFMLSIALVTPTGDTAFRAGPIEVHPSTGGDATPVTVTFVYTGVGADAAFVTIGAPGGPLFAGDSARLVATAYDSAEGPIPGTPVAWRSLDPTIAAVPFPDSGLVVGITRGTARIVAELLTGPADTVPLSVLLPPATIVADSGSGQTGPAGGLLPNRIVARVRASDGVGVANLWVRFVVSLGGGAVSADSALTDVNGRAGVTWTLGNVVGNQTVTASTPALPTDSAVFSATSTATGPGAIVISAGNNQSALVGTAVTTAPRVRVTDALGNPVPGIVVTFAVTQGAGTVTGATPTTDASGFAAAASWTLGPAVGLNALTAAVSGLTPVQFLALGTGPGGVTQMTLSAGDGQTALAHTAVPITPAVLLRDTSGAVISGVTVAFAVTAGGGAVTGAAAVSNTSGVANVGSWTLGAPGVNTLTASLSGLPDVVFQATGTVGAPDTVVVVSGNNQSADAGTALPQPLVVEVRDSAGNPVPSVAVTWASINGTVSPTTGSTDASGRAQTGWVLGTNTITQTATATATGITPAVFTATAVFPSPTVLLALAGTDRIRLSDSAQLNVTLTAPAGASGVVVNFSVDNPAVVGLDTTDLFIAQNGTTTQTRLYGLASGTTTVRATATGYAAGAASVLVTVQVLSMPTVLNVPYGGTASLPLQISTPAPSGGVVVTLVSDNPAAVGVQTPTVTIPQGQQTANAILTGVAPGTATLTGSTADFGIDQTAAATRANLNIVEGSATIFATLLDTLTVRLESSGLPVAAPGAGVQVTLTPRNAECVAATSPISIPTGLVSQAFVVSYGGTVTTPCNTYVVAQATGIDPDSVYVVVNPPPGITLYANTLGAGLQFPSNTYGYLAAANHGGVRVWIKSADPSMLLVAPDQSTVGGDSMFVDVPNGTQYFYFNLQALEGVADTGVAGVPVTARAPGFTSGAATTTIRRPAFDLYPLPSTTTTLSDSTPFFAYVGYGSGGYVNAQPVRAGGQPLTVTLVNDSAGVGDLVKSGGQRGDTLTVQIPVGSSQSPGTVATGGVAYDPDNGGVTRISGSIPGFDLTSYYNRSVTVTAPNITLYANTLGAGLQFPSNTYGYLAAANHGGVRVWIKSADPSMLLVAPDQSTVGGDSMFVDVPNGTQYFYFNLQALEGVADTGVAGVPVTARAPGFTSGAATTTIRRPAFDLYPLPSTTTTLSDSTPFFAYVGYGSGGYVNAQPVRAGGQPLTVTLTHSTRGVGRLITTAGTGDTVTVQIPTGSSQSPYGVTAGGVAFDPLTAGTTTIAGSMPGFDLTSYYNRSVTVTAPGISVYEWTVGSGLQRSAYGYLGAANHGGVNVIVKSSAPSVARVAPNDTTPGTDSIVIFVPNGQTSIDYYVQGVEGQTGTVTTTARASGFTDGTAPLNVVQPAVGFYGLPGSVSLGQPPDSVAFYTELGIPYASNQYLLEGQAVRAGGTAVTVALSSGAAAVGELVTATQRGAGVTVQIQPGQYYSPTTVAAGGVAFKKLSQGSTVVTAAIPGFITLTLEGIRTVIVNP